MASSSSSFWYGCVPAVGGLVLILGGSFALWVDRKDVLVAEGSPRPIYIRYISQATFHLQKRPHWIFLITTVLVAPFMTVTAVWQSQLATDNDENPSLTRDLKLFGFLAATSLVLVAASPMGSIVGTIFHTVFAGCVVAFGLNYSIRAQTLAKDRGDDALSITRQVSWIFGAVGALVVMFTTYPAVLCTEKLRKHEKALRLLQLPDDHTRTPEEEANDAVNDDLNNGDNVQTNTTCTTDVLKPKDIRICRLVEATLAVGQVSQAIMIGVVLISAAAEVGDVHSIETNDEALITGLVSAATATAIGVFFAVSNATFFRICQEHIVSNENTELPIPIP